jgi:molecular chaperone DnaK (HSP70)
VHAKPPYVLGIDLGTSTTCIAIIKENGTRQDIGIYVDDSDVDPCIPSIVAFAQNGELFVGEKALRQAVVNPHSTIYEVCSLFLISLYFTFLALIITEKISAELSKERP